MSKTGKRYSLTLIAEDDISKIYDYTLSEFGKKQAVKYLTGMEKVFLNLVEQPELGRKRNEIRSGLRSLVYEKHVIFYRILKNEIRIIRVLHGSHDVSKFV